MAGFTHLSERTLRQHLRPFQIGDLIEARGVSASALNTVYDLSTTRGRFIVRILENRTTRDAQFEEALLFYLSKKGLTVPRMMGAGKRGHVIAITPRQQLSVFQVLPGRQLGVFEIRPEHCRQVGEFLGDMHVHARAFRRKKKHRYDPSRLAKVLERCAYAARDANQLRDVKTLALELIRHHFITELPRGTIHGELFIDNARFERGKLSGVLDFEGASTAPLAYDLAVALCDWAFLHDRFLPERARALVEGYQSRRPLMPMERGQLYELCRFAVTRFATMRFFDFEVRTRASRGHLYQDYRHFLERLSSLRQLGAQVFREQVVGRQSAQAAP